MNSLPPLPPHLGPTLAGCLLAFSILWWFVLGRRRFTRRRLLRRRIAEFGELASTFEPVTNAKPAASGAQYRIPLFLFIGDASANVLGLLSVAHRDPTRPMIAVQARPAAVCEPTHRHERGLWFRALLGFAEHRQRLPINGIVVCVAAGSLLDRASAIEALAPRLRRLIDEAAEHLRLHLPVYLIVTGLERLDGYDAVRAALPAEVLGQALGHRLPEDGSAGAASGQRLDLLFEPIAMRMHALRMTLLRRPRAPAQRQAIYTFVEQVRALQPGLRGLVECLFERASGPSPLRWRGIYLTAAPSGTDTEVGRDAFVSDLFDHFLPADQPLAHA